MHLPFSIRYCRLYIYNNSVDVIVIYFSYDDPDVILKFTALVLYPWTVVSRQCGWISTTNYIWAVTVPVTSRRWQPSVRGATWCNTNNGQPASTTRAVLQHCCGCVSLLMLVWVKEPSMTFGGQCDTRTITTPVCSTYVYIHRSREEMGFTVHVYWYTWIFINLWRHSARTNGSRFWQLMFVYSIHVLYGALDCRWIPRILLDILEYYRQRASVYRDGSG